METAMLDNPYLDTIISMVLIYATLSVLVSMVNEWYVKHVGQRGTFLKAMIERMLNDPNNLDFGHMIYAHPAIARLRKDADSWPSYISAETIATALTDLIGERGYTLKRVDLGNGLFRWDKADEGEPLTKRFRQGVVGLNDSQIKTLLLGMADRSVATDGTTDLDKARKAIGGWFDDHMDRVSGEYKDKQRYRLFGIALGVSLFLNVDSVHLVRVIFMDEPLRMSLVQQAERVSDSYEALPDSTRTETATLQRMLMETSKPVAAQTPEAADRARDRRDSVLTASMQRVLTIVAGDTLTGNVNDFSRLITDWGLPLGYSHDQPPLVWCDSTARAEVAAIMGATPLMRYYQQRNEKKCMNWIYWAAGILLSSLALSAGSSFWFNALVKLVNIRRAGAKPGRMDDKPAE